MGRCQYGTASAQALPLPYEEGRRRRVPNASLVPARWRWLGTSVVAVAAIAAVLAHWVIDVIADYLVAHASYDDVGGHDSRMLVTAVAAIVTAALSVRAFHLCCDAAARRERSPLSGPPGRRAGILFVLGTVALAALVVPMMESIDTAIAREPIGNLTALFGGSIFMGLGTTVGCALLVGIAALAALRWLLRRCDRIVAVIAAVISRLRAAPANLVSVRPSHRIDRRRYRLCARRRGMRAPPRHVRVRVRHSHGHCEENDDSRTHRGVLLGQRHRPRTRRCADCGRTPYVHRT